MASEGTDSTLTHANENEEFRTHMEWLILVDEAMFHRLRSTSVVCALADIIFIIIGLVAMSASERAWATLRSVDQSVCIIAGPCLTFFSALCIFKGEYIPMCLPKELTTSRAAMAASTMLQVYVVYASFTLWMAEDVALATIDHVVGVFSVLILMTRLLLCCRIMSAHTTARHDSAKDFFQ